jgi:hypothetical protein
VVARNIADYTGESVIEVEEMVVATPDFSYQDYLDTRVFHLLLTVFHYEGNFEEPFAYAKACGLKPFDLAVYMAEHWREAPAALRETIEEFLKASESELFMTRAACMEWAKAHYTELVDGSLGGNLLSRYSMLGRFFALDAALDFLETSIASALKARGANFDAKVLATLMAYMRAVALAVPFAENCAKSVPFESEYDIEGWAKDGYLRDLVEHRYPAPQRFVARTEASRRALILAKIETFGEHPAGLGKFTRTMVARDLRRSLEPVAVDARASSAARK